MVTHVHDRVGHDHSDKPDRDGFVDTYLAGTEADVVFYADSESAVRSVKIVIYVKVTTTKSSKIDKKTISLLGGA